MSAVAYIMQWGDHKTDVHNHLRLLFEEQKFVDLTLFCSTHSVKVHSVVVASNSSYFEKVLLSQNGVNSVIVLKDMKFEVFRALIEFMYCGETTVLDEDVDALLYASKKFEVKGLSRMTRQRVMFCAAEKMENEPTESKHRFIFPAESAHPGMIQAVIDLTKKKEKSQIPSDNKPDLLYLKKEALKIKETQAKKQENLGLPETAISDTEYAILKEAEESRKALEKLQKYVLNPNGIDKGHQVPAENSFININKTSDGNDPPAKSRNHSYSILRHPIEDEIAAENLTEELTKQERRIRDHIQQQQQHNEHQYQQELQHHLYIKKEIQQQETQHPDKFPQNQNGAVQSTLLPADVPIFVDDGKGNYVTLDVEMANMIAGQEIKYNLVQGVVMTSDGKGKLKGRSNMSSFDQCAFLER
ncbi:hypothetical protein RUM43_001080 [Polyplax serrata]|uniref:BTB domain-containing protein n=1 Tax=Polyplax serrata TaxID=468196 RepID=A0AAN8SDT9_POLSC